MDSITGHPEMEPAVSAGTLDMQRLKRARADAEKDLTELLEQGQLVIALTSEHDKLFRQGKISPEQWKNGYGTVVRNWVETVAKSLDATFPTTLEQYRFRNTIPPIGGYSGVSPLSDEAKTRAYVAELDNILRTAFDRYEDCTRHMTPEPPATATVSMKPFPPGLLLDLQDAVAVVVWTKRAYRTFLEGALPAEELFATVDWSESKRNIAAKLVQAMQANQAKYRPLIDYLIRTVCGMEEFPDLDRDDPSGGKAREARTAIERLRKSVARYEEVTPPRSFRVEPLLAEEDFEAILKRLRSMSVVMERNPESFRNLGEEDIRNHLLMSLNPLFPGKATGETFNKSGKTDILIRNGDRNTFIAECKIWTGPTAFDAAIDQLLGYLTWRDCKCALLVFNRNKDTAAVGARMHATLTQRKEYQRTISHDLHEGGRYVLAKADEPGVEITVASMLFDLSGIP